MALDVKIDVRSETDWWRPLVQWAPAIPHLLYTGLLTGAAVVVTVAIGLAVLVTGKIPQRLAAFQVMTLRERVRAYTYFFVLRSSRPPYATSPTAVDPGDDPLVAVSAQLPLTAPRSSIIVRPLLLLPHAIVLVPLAAILDACYPVWVALAATGRGWPDGVESFLVRTERWASAVLAYAFFVTNDRPAWGLAAFDTVHAAASPPA